MAASLPDPSDTTPLVNPNPQLQTYYLSFESRIGYRLLLGGTRHFGYWDHDTYWPFPLTKALRAMEDKLAEVLALPRGAHVLDAGCGVGHVALRMAKAHGLRVSGIDIVDHHIAKARRNIARSGLPEGTITMRKMDYHHLESLADESLDGVYTMETFVHATEPKAVLEGSTVFCVQAAVSPCSSTTTNSLTMRPKTWPPRCEKSTNMPPCPPTIDRTQACSRVCWKTQDLWTLWCGTTRRTLDPWRASSSFWLLYRIYLFAC
jgi:hypothetical protein